MGTNVDPRFRYVPVNKRDDTRGLRPHQTPAPSKSMGRKVREKRAEKLHESLMGTSPASSVS